MIEHRPPLIEIKHLNKAFHDEPVLKDINLTVSEGQLLSIIGRSGCGKTTLLRCLNGLEEFDSGSLKINGISVNRVGQHTAPKRGLLDRMIKKSGLWAFSAAPDEGQANLLRQLSSNVGMLFQGINLFAHLSVLENVSIAPKIVKGLSKDEAEAIAVRYLEKVGMNGFIHKKPYQLSGGQAQRVAIARALAMAPKVMLYDEPTAALDPELVGEVTRVMKNLHTEGMTQIVVTHSMHFAETASDLVLYMEAGEIVEISDPGVIFKNPKDTRTAQYLSLLEV